MSNLEVHQVPVLSDNYVYLVRDPDTGSCAAVDPAVAEPVLQTLDRLGWKLTHIFCTHHHMDHIGGNLEVKQATGCTIVGAGADAGRIPGIDVEVGNGDLVELGGKTARVFEVPGHTSGHVAYWFENSQALFCGDTLFSLGCGRLFEGTADQMWESLSRLRGLPGETRIFCAHEYTNSNADFALSIDPNNPALKKRADEVLTLREAGKPTVPSTLADECAANPFLRADAPDLQRATGMEGRDAVEVFAEIRRRKDRF
ncbi:MAG: hydroxyacylglutathione hydrolase [Rhodospirillales bacterium]|jgi:hydroxyacylglutathione hydrolase|nr:hydroxyacylglutathione hydrolase [Rhodospirillales bacterium]